jgi:hypothetical protein
MLLSRVSYTCRSHVADVLNAVLRWQHLVIAHYAATAVEFEAFREVYRARAVSVNRRYWRRGLTANRN